MYRHRPSRERATRALLLLTLLTVSMHAAADEAGQEPFSDKWSFIVGGGASKQPRYPGSRADFTSGLPVASISYGRYFVGGAPGGGAPGGFGAHLARTKHWDVGIIVGGGSRKPRRESDAPILHGWGNIPSTVRGGMFASYTMEWLSVHGSVTEGGHHEGVIASLGLEAKFHPTPRLTLSFGPEVALTNGQYAMTFFGIDAAQSKIAGVPAYQARGGLDMLGGGAGASYELTRHWSLAASARYGRLRGDAADSPVTTDRTQRVISTFVLYRF